MTDTNTARQPEGAMPAHAWIAGEPPEGVSRAWLLLHEAQEGADVRASWKVVALCARGEPGQDAAWRYDEAAGFTERGDPIGAAVVVAWANADGQARPDLPDRETVAAMVARARGAA